MGKGKGGEKEHESIRPGNREVDQLGGWCVSNLLAVVPYMFAMGYSDLDPSQLIQFLDIHVQIRTADILQSRPACSITVSK